MVCNNNEEYKGIFYGNNDEDEPEFYEGGAHFSYIELYKILEKIANNHKIENNKEKENKLVVNLNNLNKQIKSRNNIIGKDNLIYDKIKNKGEEEKNSEKNILINKDSKPIHKRKKTLAISSFTITDKRIQSLLNKNFITKKQNEKLSPEKIIYNNRPVSLNIKNSKVKKKINNKNELSLKKGKKKNVSIDNCKNNEKKLSFSYENLNKFSSPSNSICFKQKSNNINYVSPILYKNKVLNTSALIQNSLIKHSLKKKIKDYLIISIRESKSKSRNVKSKIKNQNLENKNEDSRCSQNSKTKHSKTFHNEPILTNNQINNDNKKHIKVQSSKIKNKPHSLEKTIKQKDQNNNNNINNNNNHNINSINNIYNYNNNNQNQIKSYSNRSKKITNYPNSIYHHHPKNIYIKLQNLAFPFNSKKPVIYNIKPVYISQNNSIRSTYNLNGQLSSRNKKSNHNKTSNNQFSICKQMHNLQIHLSKNSTSNTLIPNTNYNNYYKNSKEKTTPYKRIIDKIKMISNLSNSKINKTNLTLSKNKKRKNNV
jgi:hypothetical protein